MELLSGSFKEIIERDQDISTRTDYIDWAIDNLIKSINLQIEALENKAKKQAKISGFGAIAGILIPGVPARPSKIAKNTAEAIVYNDIADELSDKKCEDLPLLNFLNEFAGAFCQLGNDFALLRTPEDFQNFERNTLKSFISPETISILNSTDFYESLDCLLGFVDMPPTKLPSFGLIPGLPGLTDLIPDLEYAEMAANLARLLELIDKVMSCVDEESPFICFSEICPEIVSLVNKIFKISLDCRNR